MKDRVAVVLAIGVALAAIPALAQQRRGDPRPPTAAAPPPTKTASEAYWDAVRAASGPIGLPQAVHRDEFTRPPRVRPRGFGPAIFPPVVFAPPEPVYVPVYVPGPVVYAPPPAAALPPAAAPPATAPASNSASVPPAPRRPEKFYVIPGCYAGNKPPVREALPPGCDIQKLRVNTW